MPAGRPAKRVAPAVRPPSARRAALTRPTEPDLPAPPVRRRRIASAAAGRPDDLPKDTASTASMVAIVTREVLKQLREDRDAALPPPSLPAPEMPVAAPLDLAVTGALSSLVDSNIYPGVRSVPRGPLASLASRPNPTGTSTLAPVMLRLLNAALTEGTRHAYKHAVTSFTAFSTTHFPASSVFPASIGALAAFVAHLFSQNYAPATLLTYMSALSYVHKLADMADPTQHFVIKKLLAGAQKLAAKPDTRLPITPTVLHKIVDATPFIVSSNYVCYMLQSMFLLSFHAFLRIGEITVHSKARHASVIQVSDVTISNSSLTLVMCHFKHNTSGRPVTLSISRTHDKYCPVLALSRFLTVRGTVQGPLYAFANATPVSRNFFCNHLTKTLKYAGLDPDKYNHGQVEIFRLQALCSHSRSPNVPAVNIPKLHMGGSA
ncbi:hypothetical protein NP493_8027g00002 [Ridgeia piscesae]|uniref:Uncharacterized protein n=1 Tax=Ridgeia piscesae TaxID=27915 RepID=A0AAD9IPD1_RIDPI|nr:hypothetical protein NP493_8027g00002 [Ridgeia piscesae]